MNNTQRRHDKESVEVMRGLRRFSFVLSFGSWVMQRRFEFREVVTLLALTGAGVFGACVRL